MLQAACPVSQGPRRIKLPCSSSRLARGHAHLKLLTAIESAPFSCAFVGTIFPPGATVDLEELGLNPVLIECAGPVGKGQYRDYLWILWKYDRISEQWKELARTQSRDASWTYVFREPARRALYENAPLFDAKERVSTLTLSIMKQIDTLITPELAAVKCGVLNEIYDRVAGRIAQLAA